MVLICLLVASLLGLAMLRTVLAQRRQMSTLHERSQCFWLAEAGMQRALRSWQRAPEYRGETWTVPAEVLGTTRPGVVVMEVSQTEGVSTARRLRVEARLGDSETPAIVCRREIALPDRPHSAAGGGNLGAQVVRKDE